MRKKFIMVLLCMTMVWAGCSKSQQNEEMQVDSKIETEDQTGADNENEDTDTSKKQTDISSEENGYGVYSGANTVAEMEMGVYENGETKVLCTVQLPTNCVLSSLYMNENGEEETMLETNGKQLSDILDLGIYEESGKISSTIVIGMPGNVDNSYTFTIFDAETYSVDYEKEFTPDGIDIEVGKGHDAYVCYDKTEQFDLVFAYQINEEWTLLIRNSGELKNQMSLEEFGQEMYQLITPVQ